MMTKSGETTIDQQDQAPALRESLEDLRKRAGVKPYRKGEPWVWAFDLEIARQIRSLSMNDRVQVTIGLTLSQNTQEGRDIADAVLRVPPYLMNLTEEAVRLVGAAVIAERHATKVPSSS